VAVALPRLAAVGDNCIDRYVGSTRPATVGGNALNVAVGLAGAGYPTAYLGAVGDDADGRLIVETARAAGVDVSDVRVLAAATGVTTVELRPGGERVFLEEAYGASELYRIDEQALDVLSGRAWVHAANLSDAAAAVHELAARGQPISYDFSDRGDLQLRAALCPGLEVAVFSSPSDDESEAASIARAAVAEGARVAVVTRGGHGSLAAIGDDCFAQPALSGEPIDTLGAGDAFVAAFIIALLDGAAIPEALRRGAASAAQTCEMIGPWPIAKEVRA
jgi:fructoselysine 6-kinase